jgi:hypothetical protein
VRDDGGSSIFVDKKCRAGKSRVADLVLRRSWLVPEQYVFRRNHFPYPSRLPDRLTVAGLVSFLLSLSLAVESDASQHDHHGA